MNKLFKPKCINRIVVFLALLAPIIYLFGTMCTYLMGAHGSLVLAQNEYVYNSSDGYNYVIDSSTLTDSDFSLEGTDYVTLRSLRGYSDVVDGSYVYSRYTSLESTGGVFTFSSFDLRSAYLAYDSMSYEGVYTRAVGVYTITGNEYFEANNQGYISRVAPFDAKLPAANSEFANIECIGCVTATANQCYLGTEPLGMGLSNAGVWWIGADVYANWANMVGQSVLYELATPVVSSSLSWSDRLIVVDESFYANFDVVGKALSYWYNPIQASVVTASNSDYLFGQMFPRDNFLAKVGQNALSDNPMGFAPFGWLLSYLDQNMLHMGASQIAQMGYGYFYWCAHVILLDVIFYFAVFFLRFVKHIGDKFMNEE